MITYSDHHHHHRIFHIFKVRFFLKMFIICKFCCYGVSLWTNSSVVYVAELSNLVYENRFEVHHTSVVESNRKFHRKDNDMFWWWWLIVC